VPQLAADAAADAAQAAQEGDVHDDEEHRAKYLQDSQIV